MTALRRTIIILAALFPASALAQDLPERVKVGDGLMTVGFELKTTTRGSDGDRVKSHSTMEYIQPKESYSWTEAERAKVARWGSMSIRERTAFFFESYKGGYNSANFEANTTKYPFLDKTVSWYELTELKLPHIELRSKPYESPREAMKDMKALRSNVSETIAFHMHTRFPQTSVSGKAEAMADWFRRVSWAIAMRRADYSSKTDFVLKSMDNQPMNIEEVENVLKDLKAENPNAKKDIIERRGIRLSRLRNSDGTYSLDIEFRGLIKDTNRLSKYLKLTADTFAEGAAPQPFKHDASSPFKGDPSTGKIKFRTFGWHGAGEWEPGELKYLSDRMGELMKRHNVSTTLSDADLSKSIKALATADTEAGKKMLLPSAFNWILMPLEYDAALPEGVQEQVEANKKKYLRKLVKLAERVNAGEFAGRPIGSASRTRKILHDFMNESYTDAGKSGKLLDWYEMSLFSPEEIEKRTKRYRRDTGKNRAEAWKALNEAGGEGFSMRRAARTAGPVQPTFWDMAEVEAIFYETRAAATIRASTRYKNAPANEKYTYKEHLDRAKNATLGVEASNDVDARYDKGRNQVRITSGLLRAIEHKAQELPASRQKAFRRKALGLVFGHELSHGYGIKAERVADAEALKVLEKAKLTKTPITAAEVKKTLEAFSENGRLSPLEKIKSFWKYGREKARLKALERSLKGGADPLAKYRRADGTLKWRQLTRDGALREGAGLAHFALALFLKELAVVAKTGDRLRIEEFFDGLMTTDFYKHYGLFVLGARAGEVAYSRYLARFVKPRFVSSIAKTNIVLAAGIALPQIVEGTFNGKAFVITLGSLGISTALVRAPLRAIKWVHDLKKARQAGSVARLGLGASRVARFGGWMYTVGELAVILLAAEEIDKAVNAYLDEKAAKKKLADAGQAFYKAINDPAATKASIEDATDAYRGAWADYRNYLYAPLHQDEALFAARMEKAAKKAKLADDRRKTALENLNKYPALKARMVRKYGSLQKYADALAKKDERELQAAVSRYADSYNKAREAHLKEVYEANRRGTPFFKGVDSLDWLTSGARPHAAGDPYGRRADVLANLGRGSLERGLRSALENPSKNRLETYDDELAALAAGARALEKRGRRDLAAYVKDAGLSALKIKAADKQLASSKDGLVPTGTKGASGALDKLDRD